MELESRENNVFFNIVKNETSVTEVFCNLMQYKPFRDMFLEIVNEKRKKLKFEELDLSTIKYNDFSTEKDFGKAFEDDKNRGRGDLILDNNGDYIFELKIERYREPTSNQPEGYLKYLEDDNSRLFFIVPKNYMHKDEIYDRWYKKTGYSKENIENHFIFWEDIIKQIRKKELDKLNLFINEFCNILDYRWFYYQNIVFSYYEIDLLFQNQKNKKEELMMLMDTNLPKVMSKLFQIVEEVDNKFDTKRESTKTEEYYGYLLKDKNIPDNWDIWFGIDYEIWEIHNCPLTIQIYSEDAEEMKKIKNLGLDLKQFSYQDGDTLDVFFITLEKSIFENNDMNITKAFQYKISEVLDKVKRYDKAS
jgi:hypothetical protein